jgi:porin
LTFSHNDQYFLFAVYDGVAGDPAHPRGTHIKFGKDDGLFIAAEWGFAHESDYKIGLGGWHHTAKVENPIDGTPSKSNGGIYIIGEKYWNDNLSTFFQYGKADRHKNQLGEYMGLGFAYKDWLIEGDNIGLASARAKNSDDYLAQNPDFFSAETTTELTYFRPITEKVSVQTSAYSVDHPSMAPDVKNSLAVGLRLYIEF